MNMFLYYVVMLDIINAFIFHGPILEMKEMSERTVNKSEVTANGS